MSVCKPTEYSEVGSDPYQSNSAYNYMRIKKSPKHIIKILKITLSFVEQAHSYHQIRKKRLKGAQHNDYQKGTIMDGNGQNWEGEKKMG